ncbi:1,4-alpha-glucan-branching enzyme 3, chloroplastic/amyloplastic [Tanacetum coccineum]
MSILSSTRVYNLEAYILEEVGQKTKALRASANVSLGVDLSSSDSISEGRSFAEILFGKTLDQSSIINESLLKGCSLHKRVEFPTESNDCSFSLANRDWDLLATPGVHQDLLSFEKMRKRSAQNELATVNAVVEIVKKNYLLSVVFDSLIKNCQDDMRKLSFWQAALEGALANVFERGNDLVANAHGMAALDQAKEVENQLRHGAKLVILRDLEVMQTLT